MFINLYKSFILISISTFVIIFSSCKEEDEFTKISIEEDSIINTDFLLGDTVSFKGENLHDVNYVYIVSGSERFECPYFNQLNQDNTGLQVDENEIKVLIPFEFSLLGKNINFDFSITNVYTSDIKGKITLDKDFKVLAPEIVSISDYEFTKRNPSYVTLKNFKKEYANFNGVYYSTERKKEPIDKGIGLDFEYINDDTLILRSTIYAEVFDFNIYFDYQNSGRSDEPVTYSHRLKIDNLKSYINYDIPTDRHYSPGSLVILSDSLHRGQIFWPSETGELEDELTVGGYKAKIPYNYPGEIPFLVPTDLPFESGDRFEVVLAKSKGYFNHDNSHNFLELVDATYKLAEDDQNYVLCEMNAQYNQYMQFEIVNSIGDTTSVPNINFDFVEVLPNGNFLLKTHKKHLPSGTNDLLIYSWDKKYQFVPAGSISYTSNY